MDKHNRRMQKLRSKLQIIVSRIADGYCPVHVSEVWIFGSALRLKEEPKDIDLVIFYKKDDELDKNVEVFRNLIWNLRETPDGKKTVQGLVEDPEFARKVGSQVFHLPIEKWTPYLRQTGTSARLGYVFHAQEVAKRTLREGMHGVQISHLSSLSEKDMWLKSMTARTFRLAWSEQKPDLEANLQHIMSREGRTISTLSELPNFLAQAERYGAYYDVLKDLTAWVAGWLSEKGDLPDASLVIENIEHLLAERGVLKEYWAWMEGEVHAGSYVSEPSIHARITNRDLDAKFSEISGKDPKTIGSITEELRDEIDRSQAKGQVVNKLLREILDPLQGYRVSALSERLETAAERALSWIPMYTASDELRREVLREVGLEHISRRIIFFESPNYRAGYRLAKSEDELKKLVDWQAEGQLAKTHVAYIRPLVRKVFPAPTTVSISVKAADTSVGSLIPSRVEVSISAEKGSLEVVQTANRLGFEKWDDSHLDEAFYASLTLDVSKFRGDVAKIKSHFRERLGLNFSSRSGRLGRVQLASQEETR
jgi:predicted nucleotidyltransferase